MAIRFQCPNCNVIRAANDRLLGTRIKCPECGGPVQLPTLEEAEASRQQRAEEKLAMQGEETSRSSQQQLADDVEALQRVLAGSTLVKAVDVEDVREAALDEDERIEAEERRLAADRASFSRPKSSSDEDMDMTPMVDVTFLLLIFFMITASFSVQKSIQRPASRNEEPSSQPVQQEIDDNPDVVRVQVDEFNAYNVITTDWDRICGSKQDLIVSLNEAHAGDSSGNQPSKLVIEAHEDCIHAAVVAALDAGREAQFENFEVNTVEQFD